MFKISDKTDTFLLNYNYLFCGPFFIGAQCIAVCNVAVCRLSRVHLGVVVVVKRRFLSR